MGRDEEQLNMEVTPESEAAATLEAMASEAEAEQRAEDEPEALTGEVVPASGEVKARAFLGVIEGGIKIAEPRITWNEEIYREGGEKLGPVFDKYNIGDSIGGRYLEEISAGFFLAGLVVGTLKGVAELKAADAKKAKAEAAAEPQREPEKEQGDGIPKVPPLVVG